MLPARALLLLLLSCPSALVSASKGERDLFNVLFANYSTLVRPVPDPSLPLTVYIKVFLQQIITLDMKNQVMELNAWIRYIWKDYRLVWNPADYENVTSIRVNGGEESEIWMPDILLYNSCDEEHFDSRFVVNAVVYSDGTVNWIPPGVFKITCKVDITWFPFDEQSCFMQFSSWTYHSAAIDLQIEQDENADNPQMDTSTFVRNGQWHLTSAPAVRTERVYSCCPEVYPTVLFWMHLRRRTLYYIFNLILPSTLISLMTLVTFILPAHDMSEKIGHQTTILLSVCFFLEVISDMTPPTSESVPLIGIYISTIVCIVAASSAFTITVLNMRYRQPGNHKMTRTFHVVFCELLPWLMLIRRPGFRFRRARATRQDTPTDVVCVKCEEDSVEAPFANGSANKTHEEDNLFSRVRRVPAEQLGLERKVGDGLFDSSSPRAAASAKRRVRDAQRQKFVERCYERAVKENDVSTTTACAILETYMALSAKLTYFVEMSKQKKRRYSLQEDWKFAAMAFDRFLLALFSIFMLVTIATMAYSAPYFNA